MRKRWDVFAQSEVARKCLEAVRPYAGEFDNLDLVESQIEDGEPDGAILDILGFAFTHQELYDKLPRELFEMAKVQPFHDMFTLFDDTWLEHEPKR